MKNKSSAFNLDNAYEGLTNLAGALLIAYWRRYPDRMYAFFESEHARYSLALIQAVMLRIETRYREDFITGCRGLTKSYVGIMGREALGILYPGITQPYFGPTLKQTAKIVSDAHKTLAHNYPVLAEMWEIVADSSERFMIRTEHKSVVEVGIMRGSNANTVFCEEVAQQEAGEQFDHEKFRTVVLPAVRVQRTVQKELDEDFVNFQKSYVTSAGRKQNPSYSYRTDILKNMRKAQSAFCIDVPGTVVVLNKIRLLDWYLDMKRSLTPEEWLREICAMWIGTSEHPVVRDTTLAESKQEFLMEDRHCGDPNVTYIVSYDVSYSEHVHSAKCATSVLKCEHQTGIKRDRFLKTVVYVEDSDAAEYMVQAQKLKEIWHRFCLDGGNATYIAIDARSYGHSVLECLHKELEDGLPPLCCVRHECQSLELDGALPVIYPINASGGYVMSEKNDDRDNENEMLRYAEVEWEQRNVRLLVDNVNAGVNAYKDAHRIKDDMSDAEIARPYIKTRELCAQISNLKKKVAGSGFKEERISKSINRDMWSATKYALRIAQRLEAKEYKDSIERESPWTKAMQQPSPKPAAQVAQRPWTNVASARPMRTGGNRRFI